MALAHAGGGIQFAAHEDATVPRTSSKRKTGEVAVIEPGGDGGSRLLASQGARNIRTLSAKYIADLQEDWEQHGKEALEVYRLNSQIGMSRTTPCSRVSFGLRLTLSIHSPSQRR